MTPKTEMGRVLINGQPYLRPVIKVAVVTLDGSSCVVPVGALLDVIEEGGPCWHCQHYGGWIRRSSGKPIYIWCVRARQVQASPQHGCAHWQLQVPARTAPLVID